LSEIEREHEGNLPKIKNNEATRQKVIDFMKAIGISDSYTVYDYPTKRHRTKKSIKKTAGFIEDLNRCIKINDGYNSAIRACEDSMDRKKKEYDNLIGKISAKEKEALVESQKQEDIKELARFQVKYETEGEWEDILDIILNKSKYLYLAHYLAANRSDWNDGYRYAETGLMGFNIENPIDQEIFDDIQNHIDNWDGDGRIFRDCKWNYGEIFNLVKDEKLMEDYNKVQEKIKY
jgi:hypothetical protein